MPGYKKHYKFRGDKKHRSCKNIRKVKVKFVDDQIKEFLMSISKKNG
jgi:hypothetical protein